MADNRHEEMFASGEPNDKNRYMPRRNALAKDFIPPPMWRRVAHSLTPPRSERAPGVTLNFGPQAVERFPPRTIQIREVSPRLVARAHCRLRRLADTSAGQVRRRRVESRLFKLQVVRNAIRGLPVLTEHLLARLCLTVPPPHVSSADTDRCTQSYRARNPRPTPPRPFTQTNLRQGVVDPRGCLFRHPFSGRKGCRPQMIEPLPQVASYLVSALFRFAPLKHCHEIHLPVN